MKKIFPAITSVLVAQTVRLFVYSILPWDKYQEVQGGKLDELINQTIVITTDADLWPLKLSLFNFKTGI